MTSVRPTKQVLKSLDKGDRLGPASRVAYSAAVSGSDGLSSGDDPTPALQRWALAIDKALEDTPLLQDAVAGFSSGSSPSRHRKMSAAAKSVVYEVRDRESPAWRGALIIWGSGDCAWMIYVNRHDLFHQAGPKAIEEMRKAKKCGPSGLDLKIQQRREYDSQERRIRQEVLIRLVEGLQQAVESGSGQEVSVPSVLLESAAVKVSVGNVEPEEWDPGTASEEPESVMVSLDLPNFSENGFHWLLRILVPFIQPDSDMVEQIYEDELKVQILMTRARLMHLLALSERELGLSSVAQPSAPNVLHYTEKTSLTSAYVEGTAVEAVCGKWWVPIGDDVSHGHLPICPDCEKEEPFAQAFRGLLERS
ncbi:DUF3039 domain-containing protein [Corynebacterium sp. AOP40-9SA-29]|uniref:DUF3039 domain-containing protein n=1 Tax=Corynebacterium sp. AOP40-9SA-29 TaxID=3457677 RepID=UPI0040343701